MKKARFTYIDDNGDLQEGMDGGVFITNVTPTSSGIVEIVWRTDTIGKNIVESITTNTENITVFVEWDGVAYDWNGNLEINNVPVTNVSRIGETRRFSGEAEIVLSGNTITALHEHGTGTQIVADLLTGYPTITNVRFINGYPPTQTEVKEDDHFDIEISFDGTGQEPKEIEVENSGACKNETFIVTWDGNYKVIISSTIDYTGSIAQELPARIRAANSLGTFSPYISTDESGNSINGENVITCNDLHPTVSFDSIAYPGTQLALKNNEDAIIDVTLNDLDIIIFSSPTGELSILNPTIIENQKTVSRLTGDYNVSIPNIQAVATRSANNSVTTVQSIVNIANILPTIVITEPYERLIKDPVGADYIITLTSSQELRVLPSVTVPEGSFTNFSGSLPGDVFVATLTVVDGNNNGVYTYSNLYAENLSGMVQTVIDTSGQNDNTYEIGGFSERDIYFDPQAIEAPLGTRVSDISKLEAVDKDLIPMTFYPDLDDHVRGYSITDPSGVYNPNGNILYWCDVMERENNTTGLSFIRIKENV